MVLGQVAVPDERLGQDARSALKVCRDGLREANIRLGKSRVIYSGVRKKYAQ